VRLNKETCKDPEAAGIKRVIGLEHLEPGDLRVRSWADVADGTTFSNRVRPGQVLFGKRRAYQRKVAVAVFDAICSGDIYVFETADQTQLLQELLPYICQTDSFFEYAVGTSAGSLSPRTNWKSLAKYEFAMPPLEEQKQIAELLLLVRNVLVEYENASAALICTRDSMNLRAFANCSVQFLGEACELVTDGEHSTPPRTPEGIYLLSARNVRDSGLDLSNVDYISEETYERLSKRVLPRWGDVLVSCSGSVGRVCCVPKNERIAMVRSVALIRSDPEKLNHEFLHIYLQSIQAQRQIRGLTNQTAQGNLFQSGIRRIKIPIISLESQLQIVGDYRSSMQALLELQRRRDFMLNLYKRTMHSLLLA
jgi:type I restriction enzyme S subunit